MIAAVDVQYCGDEATSGLVLFLNFSDAAPQGRYRHAVSGCAPYEPGNFYKRELPVLLQALAATKAHISTVIIDGFVDLDRGRPGLGRHLFDALGGTASVVGVAKTHFKDCLATEVLRGNSARPLYVTAAGMTNEEAARLVGTMAGPSRIPTLLKLADSIARGTTAC